MRLADLKFLQLLPMWMRDDPAVAGLAEGVDKVVRRLVERFDNLTMYDLIDSMDDEHLDELAWEMNLLWYNKAAPLTTKRELVKNGLEVWSKTGTVWAVEDVIIKYFGEGYVKEWFDYEGTPGHFSVYSSNPKVNNEKLNEFLGILDKVKRKSAHLDTIYINMLGELNLHAGVGVHEASIEQYRVGATI